MKIYDINEEIRQKFDLPCYKTRKSFYGKAQIIETEKGRYLLSYDTIVCFLSYGGTFVRLWNGYSATTMRHIDGFMIHVGLSQYCGKSWWDSLTTGARYDITSGSFEIMAA